jgi:hypothetical protein
MVFQDDALNLDPTGALRAPIVAWNLLDPGGARNDQLREGDALVIEPSEAHTFLASSETYLHFVIYTPGLSGGAARNNKRLVSSNTARPLGPPPSAAPADPPPVPF